MRRPPKLRVEPFVSPNPQPRDVRLSPAADPEEIENSSGAQHCAPDAPRQRPRPVRLLTPLSACSRRSNKSSSPHGSARSNACFGFQPLGRKVGAADSRATRLPTTLADQQPSICTKSLSFSGLAQGKDEEMSSESPLKRRRPWCLNTTPSASTPVKSPYPSRVRTLTLDLGELSGMQASPATALMTPAQKCRERSFNLGLLTPQSCSSNPYNLVLTPRTPGPVRDDLKSLVGDVAVIFFDFDGTLTATPGTSVRRQGQKVSELTERASFLSPRLAALRNAGILLGIISKSTAFTVQDALQAAGLADYFTGPIVGQAVGLEGKAGFIEQLTLAGSLSPLPSDTASICRILLVDDDVLELDMARDMGVQTFPAPAEGGLQEEHFDEIFSCLNVHCAGHSASQPEVCARANSASERCTPKHSPTSQPAAFPASPSFSVLADLGHEN